MQFEKKPKVSKGVWVIGAAALIAVIVVVLSALGVFTDGGHKMSYNHLPCKATQDVTPFGNQILYYDGTTLFCTTSSGSEKWSYTLGPGAGFSAGEQNVVAWVGNQLFLFDKNGRSTYNDHVEDVVQFARVGKRYVAAIIGPSISPTLIVKDLQGIDVDTEKLAYQDLVVLDAGFFSDGEYLWSTALDAYGTVPNTKLYTISVGQMNTGEVSLGEYLTYAVVYSGGELNVINTRQLTRYDYRGTKNENGTVLVYGWQLIDSVSSSGSAQLLFAASKEVSGINHSIQNIRLLYGKEDIQYTLPANCSGAALYKNKIYAFSDDSVYRAGFHDRHFTAMSLPMNAPVTDYLGMLYNGTVLLASGTDVYAVKLP